MAETPIDGDPNRLVKVAVVQAEPCWFDANAAVKKTIDLIKEAASNGAELIGFPELWIPGYPCFIWGHDGKTCAPYYRLYYRNSISVDSSQMADIRNATRDANITVILGYSERDKGSLFMSQSFIGPDGNILLHRRKFKPTHYERTVFGDGSGDSTVNVVQTPIGRIGGLQCFEHLQPLLKYNTFFQHEQIHVAAWPCLFPVNGTMPYFNSVDACRMATHTYAIEGGAFVLLASSLQSDTGIKANGLAPDGKDGKEPSHIAMTGGGFSRIIAPDGRSLAEAESDSWEGLLYHELDFNEIYVAKTTVDPVGHYSRPDIFTLNVNSKVHRHCGVAGEERVFTHAHRYPALDDESAKGSVERVRC